MKKLIALVLAMLIAGAVATAETTFTPAMFLGSRGLVVMDEKQMGGGSLDEMKEMLGGASLCAYSISSTGGDSIVFTDGGTLYAAFNMAAMFGGQGADLSQVFADFCRAYDFDCYMVQTEGNTSNVSFIKSADFPLDKVEASGGDVGLLTTSLDSFLENVAELAANRPEPSVTPEPTAVPTQEPTPEPTATPAPDPAEFIGENGEFITDGMTFTIPGYYHYSEYGDNHLLIRIDWTNTSDDAMSIYSAQWYLEVYQDGTELDISYVGIDESEDGNVLPGYSTTSYLPFLLNSESDVRVLLYTYDSQYNKVYLVDETISLTDLQEYTPQ